MSTPPFKVKAVHDYSSPHEEDLNFVAGDVITVTEEEDADWYVGEYTDASGSQKSGLFPRNFVERYEPAAPPRPTRARPKKDTAIDAPVETSSVTDTVPISDVSQAPSEPVAEHGSTKASVPDLPPEPRPEPVKPSPASTSRAPPAVSEKPSSFKDRIAAFNKSAAPPIAPKPAGAPSGQAFIKKPFVAPPPMRNSYVPPPKEQAPVQKTYRRDEDPEIAEEQAQAQRDAQAAGLTGDGSLEAVDSEDTPKPTSLKDRIALLQKQQQEQAARRAEATSKDKPKRPSHPPAEADIGEELGSPEAAEEASGSTRASLDQPHEVPKSTTARAYSHDDQAAASIASDGNEADQSGAGDTTEDAAEDESTEVDEPAEKMPARPSLPARTSTGRTHGKEPPVPVAHTNEAEVAEAQGEDENGEEEEEEEEEMDPEVRRKMELRERMAKMSGGMGMPGMFAPMAPPKKTKPTRKTTDEQEDAQSPPPTQRAPMVPIPGIPPRRVSKGLEPEASQELEDEAPPTAERPLEQAEDVEDSKLSEPPTTARSTERGLPPPVPSNRPSVPEARGAPPPPPRPSDPVAADVEAEEALMEGHELPSRGVPPPIPGAASAAASLPPGRPEGPRSPPLSNSAKRSSAAYPASPPQVPMSTPEEKRASRIPPIPGAMPMSPPPIPGEARAPPPPPPTSAPPSRQNTNPREQQDSEGESEYEGDYDTDIADGAAHKDALKSHVRDQSADETLSEGPNSPVQRAAPPPPPHQTAKSTKAVDTPRGAPPPPPPPRDLGPGPGEEDYDPYRYSGVPAAAIGQFREDNTQLASDPSLYGKAPPPVPREAPQSPPLPVHAVPPPLPPQHQELPPIEMSGGRSSIDIGRRSMNQPRRSMEQGRMSTDQSGTAHDVDLSASSLWWTQPNTTPPIFKDRADILYEIEETSSTKRGGRTIVSRDVYILFPDYSQTIVSARFDPKDPASAQLEQRHEPAPARPSQEVLEHAHSQYAGGVMATASQLVNAAAVEGGTSQGLVRKCIASVPGALAPVGTRAYGAPVYANLGNASVSQHDEIRPGDIVSFRNARFQGKHGAMHAKYSVDIAGEHVAIVSEWDGTKKKVRVWEQGRPDASGKVSSRDKVKVDSFKFGDLRSGEVKVWRVMGRSWVGWEGDGQ